MQPKNIGADAMIQRHPEIVHSAIDGEVVMMSPDLGEYFGLDAVGSRIWNLLETPTRMEDLCGTLMQSFEVDPERCHSDVTAFLREIEKCKLIAVSG